MKTYTQFGLILVMSLATAGAAVAQSGDEPASNDTVVAPAAINTQPMIAIQHMRPQDRRGIYMFEAPKNDGVPYTGFRLDWGAAFTQQFQSLDHSNAAAVNMKTDAAGKSYDANKLMDIGAGFNNASANLNLNAQLAPGIRVSLTTYLSSRHHQETWVKDGYIQIDASPLKVEALEKLMEVVTLKVGHFEVNYGDAHFRRTDNGNALYNPFIGNLMLDAFTTEIGAEAYVRKGPFLAMLGTTGGEIKGTLTQPDDRSMTLLAKLGFDHQVNKDLRVRLTGSRYQTGNAISNTLYSGDRAGARYHFVLENVVATTTSQFTSGNINPGFRNQIGATMINPFVKFRNLELFGTLEQAKGQDDTEAAKREIKQYAIDGIYRLFDDQLYVGARYNQVDAQLKGMANEVSMNRTQLGGGWFVTPSLLMKAEYVTQKYNDFPLTDIRSGGKFNGLVLEGVVAF